MGVMKYLIAIIFCLCLTTVASAGWLCSGFFIDGVGDLGTAGHCVKDAKQLYAIYKGVQYAAKIVGVDYNHDTAIININAQNTPGFTFQLLKFPNDEVFVLGYPAPDTFGYNLKVTEGQLITNGSLMDMNVLACHGNSGGAVVNTNNELIGILVSGSSFGNGLCSLETQAQNNIWLISLATEHGIQLNIKRDTFRLDFSKKYIRNLALQSDSVIIILGE